MTALANYFEESELASFKRGVRTFIRLTGMISDEFQYRWFADEHDAVSALQSVATGFHKTKPMLGASKYQGQPFDAVRQVREDLAASMMTGHTEMTTVANRKRYSPLYYLMIEPAVNLFAKFDHQTILDIVDECSQALIDLFNECDAYGTYDDALVAQAITRNVIREREEAAKLAKSTRKRRTKKDPMIEAAIEQEEEVEDTVEAG